MDYAEVLKNARLTMSGCKACPVCNGRACTNHIPGPGAKGIGDVAIRNYDAWKKIRINMDTLCANTSVDTSFDFFGHTLAYPIFAGPVGDVQRHYGSELDDFSYNDILVSAARKSGIMAFTGDGLNPKTMQAAAKTIKQNSGLAIPTVKPWDLQTLQEKFALIHESGARAVAMDIDAAGLPFLQNRNPPAGSKTKEELAAIIKSCKQPFIVKGIMTPAAALKAAQAGACAIVVSNHGGRVLDQCPSTAEVLPEIVSTLNKYEATACAQKNTSGILRTEGAESIEEVEGAACAEDAEGNKNTKGAAYAAKNPKAYRHIKIFVDGGIRSGADIFKALALGADAVLIARPFATAVYGAKNEGVQAYVEHIGAELKDTMRMCGAHTLLDISADMLFNRGILPSF